MIKPTLCETKRKSMCKEMLNKNKPVHLTLDDHINNPR